MSKSLAILMICCLVLFGIGVTKCAAVSPTALENNQATVVALDDESAGSDDEAITDDQSTGDEEITDDTTTTDDQSTTDDSGATDDGSDDSESAGE